MLNHSAIPRRFPKRYTRTYTLLLAFTLAASSGLLAHASTLSTPSDCSASGDSLKCYLHGFLNFLYAAAGVLALVLIVVVVLAVNAYRKNKNSEKIGS